LKRFMSFVVAHPILGLVTALLVAAVLGSRIPELRTDVSPTTLMIADDPGAPIYERAKEQFGSDELTLVVVKAADVFQPRVLEVIETLSEELQGFEGVTRVDSLSTVHNVRGDGEWLTTDKLMRDGVPSSPEALASFRRDALRNPLVANNLVASDARAAGILVYTDAAGADHGFDARFSRLVEELVERVRTRSRLEIYQYGRPATQTLLSDTIIGDQLHIVPISLGVLSLVLIAMFRSPHVVVISGAARLLSVVWALGIMAFLGYPVTLLTALIPTLLITIGFTEDVHLIAEYHEKLRRGYKKEEALRRAAETVGMPLFVTSFTTAVGFASLSLSPIVVLGQLGRVAGLAFLSSYVVTVLVVPALLHFWPEPRVTPLRDESDGERLLERVLVAVGDWVTTHRRATLAAAAVVFTVGSIGASQIYVDNAAVGFFRPDSTVRQRHDDVAHSLTGPSMFYVMIEAPAAGAAASAELQSAIVRLQDEIEATGEVSRTLSAADYIRLVHREMNGGDDEAFVVPDDDDLIAQYLELLHPGDLEKHLSYDRNSTNIMVRHQLVGTHRIQALTDRIAELAAKTLPPGAVANVTSEGILQAHAAYSLASGMVTGLSYTIVIVTIVCALFFMSVRAGLLAVPPNVLPIVAGFGAMGFAKIPLNVGTAMVATVAVGIAIDDTVHYMARNSAELDRRHDVRAAMRETLRGEGRAIVATSIALACGFLVMQTSSFLPLAWFGVIAAFVMIVALVSDLTLTPALASTTTLLSLWNVVGLKMGDDVVEQTPLFAGMSRWEMRKVVLMGRLHSAVTGEYVVRRGEHDTREMYVVVTGRLRAVVPCEGGEFTITMLEPGALFGEMALVEARERSADVVADCDCEVLSLSASDLLRLRRRFPRTALKLFANLSAILSRRLRDMTERAAAVPSESRVA
jgi:predicted RND superfamily exporter protein